ncbi:hypothetical protein MMC26_002435 [Xylographa opegraphella]|nr:hypothetical protein [Xylographa opegraphella]
MVTWIRDTSASLPANYSTAPIILALQYILLSLTIALIIARCHGRLRVTKDWGWDDTTINFALIFLLIGAVLVTIETQIGLGRHVVYLGNPELDSLQVLKYNTFFQVDNVLCTFMTKVSISLYILRIKNNRPTRIVLVVGNVLNGLATLATIIVLCLSCIPLDALWDPSVHGKCLPLTTVYIVARIQSAFAVATDLLLTVSPIAILWRVRIKRGKKIRICSLMSLGLVATFSNALRNLFQPELTDPDFTYAITPISCLAIIELNSGVIAACIPACVPYFNRYKAQRFWYPLQSHATSTTNPTSKGTITLASSQGTVTVASSNRDRWHTSHTHEVDEECSGIRVTNEILMEERMGNSFQTLRD